MFKVRLAILGASATLVLGTASVLAMSDGTFGGGNTHGAAVASAARNCPVGAGGVHGACVSSVARTNGASHSNGSSGNEPAFVKACKALRSAVSHNKPGSRGIGACVSAAAKAQGGGSGS